MSIEEIAAKMGASDERIAWLKLVEAVQIESEKLDAIRGTGRTFRSISELVFSLDDGTSVNVIVRANSRREITWTRIESLGPNVLPQKDSGRLEIVGRELSLHGKLFSSATQAALFLIQRITESRY